MSGKHPHYRLWATIYPPSPPIGNFGDLYHLKDMYHRNAFLPVGLNITSTMTYGSYLNYSDARTVRFLTKYCLSANTLLCYRLFYKKHNKLLVIQIYTERPLLWYITQYILFQINCIYLDILNYIYGTS